MPVSPHFESLPQDDQLRVVYWAGLINAQSSTSATPRFTAWLQPINESGEAVIGDLTEVVESVGSISLFPIGSCWKQGRRVHRPARRNEQVLEIEVPDQWEVRRVIEKPVTAGSTASSAYIQQSDMNLTLRTASGTAPGFKAFVVVAKTTAGQQVLIPCFEIFRAFHAGTSDLANGLFQSSWSTLKSKFIVGQSEGNDHEGALWHLDLAPTVSSSVVHQLCWLTFIPGAAAEANKTHASLVNQAQVNSSQWIKATPPISKGVLRLNAVVKPLSQNSLLVTQIREFDTNIAVSKITCTIEERSIPSGAGGEKGPNDPAEKIRRSLGVVAKPRDRRKTRRQFQIAGDPIRWKGLPTPEVTPRKLRQIPVGGQPVANETSVPTTVAALPTRLVGVRIVLKDGVNSPDVHRRIDRLELYLF